MQSRRLNTALALIVLAGLLAAPAFFFGWLGLLLLIIPLFAAVVIALKPRSPK